MTTPRSLAPKEHGAYAQLGLPVVAALASGRPTIAAFLLAIAAVAVFVAHEPLLVLIGHRGMRAAQDDGRRAARLLAALVSVAVLASVGAVVLGGAAVATAGGVPLLLAPLVAVAIARGAEKTLFGEIGGAATLSSCGIPIAIASGVTATVALAAWATWVVAFMSATLAVRGVIAHRKRAEKAASPLVRIASVSIAPLFAVTVAVLCGASYAIVIAAAPVVVASLVLASSPPHPRTLARVGWALVVASLATTVLVVREGRAQQQQVSSSAQ
ncbi:MAG: YwiC-like family protein [Polyangiales bacterium]